MKNKIFFILKLIITVLLLIYIFNSVDIGKSHLLLMNIDLKYFILALSLLMLQILIANMRWWTILSHLNMHHGQFKLLRYFWAGLFFSQALPSTIGGDALRGYYLFKNNHSIRDATFSIFLDRFFGLLALLIIVFITLPLLLDSVSDPVAQQGVIIISSGVFFLILGVLFFQYSPSCFLKMHFFRELSEFSIGTYRLFFSLPSGLLLSGFSLCIHILSFLTIAVLSKGIGLDIDLLSIFLVVPFVSLIMVVPISIAGWGVREGAMVLGFSYFGVVSDQSLALSILYGLSLLSISLPGCFFWVLNSRRVNKHN